MEVYMTVREFSRITGFTTKALRLYDREGLLRPAWVDENTRYRYYLPSQISDAIRVKILRNLGVSLKGIRNFLNEQDGDRINAFLNDQAEKMRKQIWERQRDLLFLEQLVKDSESVFLAYEVSLQEVPAQLAVSISEKVPKEQFDTFVVLHRARLHVYLAEMGERPVGSSFALLHHEAFRPPVHYELETCLPVRRALPGAGEIACRTIPGGTMASTLHRGPYEGIQSAYGAILRWMEAHSHIPLRPMREIYLTDPEKGDPEAYRTEVLWPIR